MAHSLPQKLIMHPNDLYKHLIFSKSNYDFIMEHISQLVNYYSNTMPLDIEKFMWNLFDNINININKQQLFIKMLQVYSFANSNIIEQVWKDNYIDESYGPLPEDQLELYNIKFKTGMIYILCNNDNISNPTLELSLLWAYSSNIIVFKFLFKFINKYKEVAIKYCELLLEDIEEFIEKNITFGTIDDYLQIGFSYGINYYNMYNEYVRFAN